MRDRLQTLGTVASMVRTVRAALLAGLVMLTCTSPALAETPPPESLFSPRVLELPAGASGVELLDSLGNHIPLTGVEVEDAGSVTLVYPPRLPPGSYMVRWTGGERQLTVDGPNFVFEAASGPGSGGNVVPVAAAAVSGLAAGLLLLRRRRRVAAGLVLAAAGAGTLLLLPPGGGEFSDPCLGETDVMRHQQCSFEFMYATAQEQGVEAAVSTLMRLSGPDGDVRWRQQCHETAHLVGEVGWKKERSVEAMVAAGDPDCQFGYFHGMLEAMGAYLDDQQFPVAALRACALIKSRFGDDFSITGGCAHGAGHASMWRHGGDLTPARAFCAGFPEEAERDECVSGAVMEWVASRQRAEEMGSERDLPLPRVTNPFDLCAEPYGEMSAGCAAGAALGVTAEQRPEAAELCVAQDPSVQAACLVFLTRTILDEHPFDMQARVDGLTELCEDHDWDVAEGRCYSYLGYSRFLDTNSRPEAEAVCALLSEASAAAGCREGIVDGERYQQALTGG